MWKFPQRGWSNGRQDHGHFLVLNGGMLNFYDIDDPIDVEVTQSTVQAMKGIGNEVKKWTKQFSVEDAIHMSLDDVVP